MLVGLTHQTQKIYTRVNKLYSLHQGGNENQITTNATAISSTKMVVSLYAESILWIAHAARSNVSKCLLKYLVSVYLRYMRNEVSVMRI